MTLDLAFPEKAYSGRFFANLTLASSRYRHQVPLSPGNRCPDKSADFQEFEIFVVCHRASFPREAVAATHRRRSVKLGKLKFIRRASFLGESVDSVHQPLSENFEFDVLCIEQLGLPGETVASEFSSSSDFEESRCLYLEHAVPGESLLSVNLRIFVTS